MVSIGTSEGKILVILWPRRVANLYPLPSEPVFGYDFPPVAITTFLAINTFSLFFEFTIIEKLLSSFFIIFSHLNLLLFLFRENLFY